jgi:F-type H+-transporting ATPase subunit delta
MQPNGEHRRFHPTADVGALRVAHVYAQALLTAAEKQGRADEVFEQLNSLIEDVFAADPRVESFLASPAVPRPAKAPVLRAVFGDRAGPLFTNFLLVLNDHGRLELLRHVRFAYRQLLDERQRRVRVQVRSAVPLPDDQRQRLEQDLREAFRLNPVLETQVDPDLLGGLTVRVGDWLYDASLRTQLQTIRNQIMARSSYEIQRGGDRFRSPAGD